MTRYRDVILNCFVIAGICYQFNLIDGATTARVPPTVSKKNESKSSSKFPAKTGGKIITLRLGSDGSTSQEQCECRLFYLCEKDNTIDTASQNGQR